jgi:hypothetical protein
MSIVDRPVQPSPEVKKAAICILELISTISGWSDECVAKAKDSKNVEVIEFANYSMMSLKTRLAEKVKDFEKMVTLYDRV